MLIGQGEALTQLEGQLFPNIGPGCAGAISQEKQVLLPEVMVAEEKKNILLGKTWSLSLSYSFYRSGN